MYIVTFYSYRGGVGRTMALANTAAELAKRGRRILIVDFDLEAPGISTFSFSDQAASGVVDYINDYLTTGKAPPVDAFVQKCELTGADDETFAVWLMSAGKQDDQYGDRFQSISWEQLYSENAGFLMMENLKEQWRDLIKPDYVFIDSRTGHTDIGGICTRQLPDAVVFNFFPNLQNLCGLKQVVKETRQEAEGPRKKHISTHFVACNVPDIDDDSGILRDHLKKFEDALKFDELISVHHYPSLLILNQDIFTLVRPNTKLSKEYVKLTDAIIRNNPEDRDGALSFVERTRTKVRSGRSAPVSPADMSRLAQISGSHPNDGQIHALLGDLYFQARDFIRSTNEYEMALKAEFDTADVLLSLSFLYEQTESHRGKAIEMLVRLMSKAKSVRDITVALYQLIELDEHIVPSALQGDAVRALSLEDRLEIAPVLRTRKSLVPYAMEILEEYAVSAADERDRKTARHNALLCKIAMGDFAGALQGFGSRTEILSDGRIQDVFNYAMAEWGLTGKPSIDLFARTIELQSTTDTRDANYAQCLAIATFVVGSDSAATEWLAQARHQAGQKHSLTLEFSCWSYLNSTIPQFIEDLEKIRRMLQGEEMRPSFIEGSSSSFH